MRKQLDPCPPRPHPAETNLPIRIAKDVELATNDEPQEDVDEGSTFEADMTVTLEFMSSVLESITIEEESTSEILPAKTPTKAVKPRKTTPARRPRTKASDTE